MINEYLGEIQLEIQGTDLSCLDNEAGGHRIQRVPPTERKGRVHTSTVTVAVIADNTISVSAIPNSELKIEWYSGTGCGGQYRNKHQNSCRITHIPTGVIVTSQQRSRQNSLALATDEINRRVSEAQRRIVYDEIAINRKQQVGSGMRGDKIRTYRFQDDVVKDHITNKSASLKKVLAGNFSLLWN